MWCMRTPRRRRPPPRPPPPPANPPCLRSQDDAIGARSGHGVQAGVGAQGELAWTAGWVMLGTAVSAGLCLLRGGRPVKAGVCVPKEEERLERLPATRLHGLPTAARACTLRPALRPPALRPPAASVRHPVRPAEERRDVVPPRESPAPSDMKRKELACVGLSSGSAHLATCAQRKGRGTEGHGRASGLVGVGKPCGSPVPCLTELLPVCCSRSMYTAPCCNCQADLPATTTTKCAVGMSASTRRSSAVGCSVSGPGVAGREGQAGRRTSLALWTGCRFPAPPCGHPPASALQNLR